MELYGAVLLFKKAAKQGIKISGICINNNTTTKLYLQEDSGKNLPGCMEKELTVTNFYTNLSHHKKIYNKGLNKIFSFVRAKKMAKSLSY